MISACTYIYQYKVYLEYSTYVCASLVSLHAYASFLPHHGRFGHQDPVTGMDSLARERPISSGGFDKTVRVWKVLQQQPASTKLETSDITPNA